MRIQRKAILIKRLTIFNSRTQREIIRPNFTMLLTLAPDEDLLLAPLLQR